MRTGAAPKDDKSEKISSSEAEGLVRKYFSDYKIKEIEFQGETTTRRMEAYNFTLTDENDLTLFAQVSERDGKLISFSIRVHRGRGADGKQLKPWIQSIATRYPSQ